MNVAAVIPCYNESEHIEPIIKESKKHVDTVIVSDDSSKDDTVMISRNAGALIVSNINGRHGAGVTTWRGIWEANRIGADIIVTLDGDGQHSPYDIPRVINPLIENKCDMVTGTRIIGYDNMPTYRRIGNDLLTLLYNVGYKDHISDSQCGFRAYKRDVFNKVRIDEDGFGFCTEILIKARRSQLKIHEVPIMCIYHQDLKSNSTLSPIIHASKVASNIIKWRLNELAR